ncbi:uncharacterized protein [Choristoneura fumiferana]|uniref:uncharacterized protein n=1 Tax=Choristoneura fumiferana TaxID=7141 RepID=UPI003D15E282
MASSRSRKMIELVKNSNLHTAEHDKENNNFNINKSGASEDECPSDTTDGYPSSPLPQGAVNVYEEMRDVWDEVFSDVNNYKELHSTIEKCQLNKEDTIKTATTASSDVLNKDAYMPTETMSPVNVLSCPPSVSIHQDLISPLPFTPAAIC